MKLYYKPYDDASDSLRTWILEFINTGNIWICEFTQLELNHHNQVLFIFPFKM